jgi:hypothetical protein
MIYDRVLSFARHSMCTKQVLKLATAASIYGSRNLTFCMEATWYLQMEKAL